MANAVNSKKLKRALAQVKLEALRQGKRKRIDEQMASELPQRIRARGNRS